MTDTPEYTNLLVEQIERRNYEVKSAAKDLARKGLKGETGDPLPELMSVESCTWIAGNVRAFKAMVKQARADIAKSCTRDYFLMMNGFDPMEAPSVALPESEMKNYPITRCILEWEKFNAS